MGEEVEVRREPENPHDRHAVALYKAEEVVGHVPRELSKIMFKFMEYGGHITCQGGESWGTDWKSMCIYLMWH